LGFAVATALAPDVVLADEVLAVGDINFRVKCYNKIRDIQQKTAVILVSHNMFDISKSCHRVLLMSAGQTKHLGSVEKGISSYNELNLSNRSSGTELVAAMDSTIKDCERGPINVVREGNAWNLNFVLRVQSTRQVDEIFWRVVFFDSADAPVAEWKSATHGFETSLEVGWNTFELPIQDVRLAAGNYRVVVVITDRQEMGYLLRIDQGLNIALAGIGAGGPAYLI
jgi:lipopolysaccharide transport system ATP-binding protein